MFFDTKLLGRLKRLAERRNVSVAHLVREAVAQYLIEGPVSPAVPTIAGSFASGRRDTAGRVDEILWSDPHP